MLNMNPVVQVNVSVGVNTVTAGVFDVGALVTPEAGTNDPLSTTNRFATYSSLAEMASGIAGSKPAFASTTDTYKAAEKYFGVAPAPAQLVVIFYSTASGTDDTPVVALTDAFANGAEFYGVYYIPPQEATASATATAIASLVSALDSMRTGVLFYGFVGTVADATGNSGLFATLKASGTNRAMGMYCTSAVDDAAGLMGLAMGMALNSNNRAFALCYKGIASATANVLTQTEVDAIKAVNGNVFVARTKTGAKLENGAVASGLRYDEVLFIDKIVSELQISLFNMIAGSVNKLPQTDSTSTLFVGEVYRILEGYYNNGVLADAPWRGLAIRTIDTGDIIEHGYIAFVDSFDTQTAADRAAHKAMPITVLICLSGSVESIVINLDVQT